MSSSPRQEIGPRSAAAVSAGDTGSVRVCESCGGRAQVHVLVGYSAGQPLRHHTCLACPPGVSTDDPVGPGTGGRTRLTTLAMAFGVLLVVGGLTRDWVMPTASEGFGRNQLALLAVGCLVLVVGVALRIDVIAIGSMLVIGVAVLADILGQPGAPGVGWKQGAAWKFGLLLVAAAWFIRRRVNRQRRTAAQERSSERVADA